jgi:hypothetical protein
MIALIARGLRVSGRWQALPLLSTKCAGSIYAPWRLPGRHEGWSFITVTHQDASRCIKYISINQGTSIYINFKRQQDLEYP